MTDTEAEQRQIEQYLKQFCIEECLDEVLNAVLVDRPLNPYTAIASAIELKTLPELLDVHLYSVLHRSQFSVKAIVETNIGSFSGIAVYNEQPGIDELDEPKDYTAVEQSVREALVPLDPKNLKQIDEAIVAINNIDPAETLAISMAMCRAGAKFSGVKVNEHIATLAGLRRDEMVIPLPVLSVITREMGFVPAKQVIQLFPVKASDLEQAFNKLRQAVRAMSKCKRMQVPPKFDSSGTQFLDHTANLEEMLLITKEVFNEHELHSEVKLGIHWAAEKSLKLGDAGTFASTYVVENNQIKTGQDLVERMAAVWQDLDVCSMDDVLAAKDTAALRTMKKRVNEVCLEVKNSNADRLRYCQKGVGGDGACHLQVVADSSLLEQTPDLDKQLAELPYNALRLTWNRLRTVSEAIDLCQRSRKASLPIIIHSGEPGLTCQDDLDVDLAVGVGASQYHTGGLHAAEVSAKLNRLRDIKLTQESIPYVGIHFRAVG